MDIKNKKPYDTAYRIHKLIEYWIIYRDNRISNFRFDNSMNSIDRSIRLKVL